MASRGPSATPELLVLTHFRCFHTSLFFAFFRLLVLPCRIVSATSQRACVVSRLVRRKWSAACRRPHSTILAVSLAHALTLFPACAAMRPVSPFSASPTGPSTSASGGARAARPQTPPTTMRTTNSTPVDRRQHRFSADASRCLPAYTAAVPVRRCVRRR